MTDREWRGSVFKRSDKDRLWIKVFAGGEWKSRPTPYPDTPDGRRQAEELLANVREEILAREAAAGGEVGPLSVRAWSKRWLEKRTASRADDESILKNHVLPAIGNMLIADVRTRHILELVESWQPKDAHGNRAEGAPAPRTVRNRYSSMACMFRHAALANLIAATPCTLKTPELPSPEDADPEWRITARFTLPELEVLISPNEKVEADSTVVYATLGLADLRHGELAALRWRHVVKREPLDGLLIANSNARRRTKKGKTRLMPIHPALAAILADWKLAGWARLIGRAPTDDDLIFPLPLQPAKGRRFGQRTELVVNGDTRRRTKDHTWKRADRHLEDLGLRHRRVHDLRRTFIGLATAAGADDRVLHWGTHGRPGDIMGAYGDADWERLCAEVLKLKVARRGGRKVVPMRRKAREDG